MIDIGMIAHGPGQIGGPIGRAIRDLRTALASGSNTALELAYVVPGPQGRADFDGFELGRSRSGHVIVFIEVPASTTRTKAPMADLIELGRRAIAFAKANLSPARAAAIDFDDLLKSLDELGALDVGADPASPLPAPSDSGSLPGTGRKPSSDRETLIEVSLPLDDREATTEAFELEQALRENLEGSGVGYVDGNEVGLGEFTIFVYGPKLGPLRASVESVLREYGKRPGARLSISGAGSHDSETATDPHGVDG